MAYVGVSGLVWNHVHAGTVVQPATTQIQSHPQDEIVSLQQVRNVMRKAESHVDHMLDQLLKYVPSYPDVAPHLTHNERLYSSHFVVIKQPVEQNFDPNAAQNLPHNVVAEAAAETAEMRAKAEKTSPVITRVANAQTRTVEEPSINPAQGSITPGKRIGLAGWLTSTDRRRGPQKPKEKP